MLFALLDPPTQHLPPAGHGPDDKNRDLSARLAKVEASQIDLRTRLDDLFLQFMTSKQQENELSRDLAVSSRESILETIADLGRQREALISRKIKADTATEVLLFDMMDDNIQQRIERSRAELDRASKVVVNKSEALVRDSQKIEALKTGKPDEPNKQIFKPAWWNARFDRIADALLIVLAYAVLQEWILPLLNVAFAK